MYHDVDLINSRDLFIMSHLALDGFQNDLLLGEGKPDCADLILQQVFSCHRVENVTSEVGA